MAEAQETPKALKPSEALAKIVEAQEGFKDAILKEVDELRKQNAMLAQAMVALTEKVSQLSTGQGEGSAKQDPIAEGVRLLRALTGEEKKPDPMKAFAEQTENIARMVIAIDHIRSPPDSEGTLAKHLLWRQALKASTPGLPRYMTKDELKRYGKLLDRSLGLEEFEEEEGGEDHVKG